MKKLYKTLLNLSPKKIKITAIALTLPTFIIWVSAFVTYFWINIIAPAMQKLPVGPQTLVFLGLPAMGFAVSLLSYKQKASKFTLFVILINAFFLVLTLFASFRS